MGGCLFSLVAAGAAPMHAVAIGIAIGIITIAIGTPASIGRELAITRVPGVAIVPVTLKLKTRL